MLNYMAGLQSEILASSQIYSVYEGIIGEHIVGQELLS